MASRTAVRDTPKRCAISLSSRGIPGASRPCTISSAITLRSCSVRVVPRRALLARTASDIVDHADVGGDDAPAAGEPDPGLALASDTAGSGVALEQRAGRCQIPPEGRDHRSPQVSRQSERRSGAPKRTNLVHAVEILRYPISHRLRIVPEQRL